MTDTDAQRLLRELQAEAVSVFEYDTAVSGILADELPYYFAEEQSAGQIADRIQRRVQLLVARHAQLIADRLFLADLHLDAGIAVAVLVAESRGFRCCAETRRMI